MTVEKQKFGKLGDNDVDLYVLSNKQGMQVKVTNYGGIITSIKVPDSNGNIEDVVCGFDNLEGYFSKEYQQNSPYFGCIVGRYAARIKDGTFNVEENTYRVATNDGPNHLHGGIKGFDKQLWQAEIIHDNQSSSVRLTLNSADGDEGYPGNLNVTVEYILTESNALKINYSANTDKTTPLSLTNHTYFNLTGFKDDIKDHQVQIQSGQFLKPDATNVPVGEQQKVNGLDNLNTLSTLRASLNEMPQGFEHYYVFDKAYSDTAKVAQLYEPKSGRRITITTSEPGMLFYTGFYTSDKLQRESGAKFGQFRALCFETSKFPNGPNISNAPNSLLAPSQNYNEQTEFQFSW